MTRVQTANEILLRANETWESGRNKAALELFLRAAQLGSASAQHNVGYFYDEGIGTKRNLALALSWYRKAWRNDHQSGTCINIAKLYESKNQMRLAIVWWKKAVAENDGDAALGLAKFYLQRGKARDSQKAEALLKLVGAARATGDARQEAAKFLKKLHARVELGKY
jgi:TPR repeat protein